jgi:CheY-like chemotaxis protein
LSDHILIVDDDATLRESLRDALEFEGYTVASVEHGAAALQYLKSAGRPCLILLDLMMPVMDGKTFREAMLRDPALASIPVVLITAAGLQMAAGVAVAGVLQKPLRVGTVVALVKQHCAGVTPS